MSYISIKFNLDRKFKCKSETQNVNEENVEEFVWDFRLRKAFVKDKWRLTNKLCERKIDKLIRPYTKEKKISAWWKDKTNKINPLNKIKK